MNAVHKLWPFAASPHSMRTRSQSTSSAGTRILLLSKRHQKGILATGSIVIVDEVNIDTSVVVVDTPVKPAIPERPKVNLRHRDPGTELQFPFIPSVVKSELQKRKLLLKRKSQILLSQHLRWPLINAQSAWIRTLRCVYSFGLKSKRCDNIFAVIWEVNVIWEPWPVLPP